MAVQYERFYTYEMLTGHLKDTAARHEDIAELSTLCETPEGRQVWLMTVTDPSTGSAEDKPAYYVQANVHAHEMYGTTAALDFLQAILDDDRVAGLLEEVTFFVVPRVNPDGTEYALDTTAEVRSRLRVTPKPNGLIPEDLNGDGMITKMRWEDPTGAWTEDPQDPRIMVPRMPGDEGPFYQVQQEGVIHEYDGGPIVSGTEQLDFNRNYPANWDHNTDRSTHPFSQPEVRAVGTFLLEHPNIFAGIDFHGGTPAILRPSTKPDSEMNQADVDLIHRIGQIASEHTGFDLMNARDYRASWRQPHVLHGNSNDFAYFELGVSWYVIEVGWGYSTAGIGPDESFDADQTTRERDFMRRIMAFADEHEHDTRTLFVPWEEYEHPQLGGVEIGGMTKAAVSHVYPPQMQEISDRTTGFLFEHVTWHPRIELSGVEAVEVAPETYRIRAEIANTGPVGTNVMSTGASAKTHEQVLAQLEGIDADIVLSRPRMYQFDALGARSRQQLEWFIHANPGDEITIHGGHPRGGWPSVTIKLP